MTPPAGEGDGTAPAWDPDHARAETAWTVETLCRETPSLARHRGKPVTLELTFLPETGTAERLIRALAMFGYRDATIAEDGSVEVSVDGTAFEADAIWHHEDRTARIALANGFRPEGWGFFEP